MSVRARSILCIPLRISALLRYHQVHDCTRIFQQCLNKHQLHVSPVWTLHRQSRLYARYSGFASPGDFGNVLEDPEFSSEFEDEEMGDSEFGDEEMDNYISLNEYDTPQSLQEEMEREDVKHRQRFKRRIIERKFFRPPKEVNLLTWQAKSQIRHLNRISPEKWTPDYLAYHFPVSKDGIIRILQNSYSPDSERATEKHDGRVKQTWKKLKDLLYIQRNGKLTDEDEELWNGVVNRLSRLANASGIPDLPMPKRPNFDPPPEKPPGPFGSLIRNHRQQLRLIEGPSSEAVPKINLENVEAENVIHLNGLLRRLAKTSSQVTNDGSLRDNLEHSTEYWQENNIQAKNVNETQPKRDRLHAKLTAGNHSQTHSHDGDKIKSNSDGADKRRPSVPGPAPVKFRYLPEPSTKHHGFSANMTSSGTVDNQFIARYNQNRGTRYNKYKSDSTAGQYFNINKDNSGRFVDKYVNRQDENLSEHKEPREISHQDKYYGQTVYDEDGHFLYRIPG